MAKKEDINIVKEFKEKLQKSFEAVINKIKETDITATNKSQYQKKIKHACSKEKIKRGADFK